MVIETTGLADPAPILATLMSDPVAARAYRLDGIVTVVDAVNGMTQLDAQPEAVRQAAVADRIVLSKTDLADPPELRERLRRLNPGAPLLTATHGEVDAAALLHAGLFDPDSKIPDVRGWLDAEAYADAHHAHHHDPQPPRCADRRVLPDLRCSRCTGRAWPPGSTCWSRRAANRCCGSRAF